MTRLVLVLAASLLARSAALAGTVTVQKGGAHPTIQSGVDAAGASDTVRVKKGVYVENVTIPAGKNGLALVADGSVTIDARTTGGAAAGPGIAVGSSRVLIKGFTIQNAGNTGGGNGDGIQATADHLEVTGCVIRGCTDEGIEVANGGATKVTRCRLTANQGESVSIVGDDVVVADVTVQSGGDVGVHVDGERARATRCSIANVANWGIYLKGASCRVEKCTVDVVENWGIYIDGSSGLARGNQVTAATNWGIYLTGVNATVTKNRVLNTDNWGVHVNGSGAEIGGNTIVGAANYGIELTGDNATIEKNKITSTADRGISATGTSCVVRKNRILDANGTGIDVFGTAPTILDNSCTNMPGDQDGIHVDGGAVTSGRIEGNRVRNASHDGISVTANCSNLVIRKNVVEGCGDQADEHGFRVFGSGHTIDQNVAKGNASDGLHIGGSNLSIAKNLVRDNARDGIDLDGGSNDTIDRNRAFDNGAEGIENNAAGTQVTDNVARRNRIDFANSGGGSTFSGNVSGDGTANSPPPPELE